MRTWRFVERVTTAVLCDDLTDMQMRLSEFDRMGIDVQVLSGWIDLTGYELSGAAAAEYSHAHNEALAVKAARFPERFRTLGIVPLQDPGLAVVGLDRAMNELDMAGVEIATTVDTAYLDQVEGLDAFWEAAAEMKAFVLLHPMRPLSGIDLGRYFMENMIAQSCSAEGRNLF